MVGNPHFEKVLDWKAARALLAFRPLEPGDTAGCRLQSIVVHVRDHKMRELAIEDRTLEAHYGAFVLSQARKGTADARRLALEVSYGRDPKVTSVAGHAGRIYDLGPQPEPGDVDGRSPAVLVWHDAGILYLIASGEMQSGKLLPIALSLYPFTGRPAARGKKAAR